MLFRYIAAPAGVYIILLVALCKTDAFNFYNRVTKEFLKKMADSNRIHYPDEVPDAKAAAAENADQNKGGDSNSIEEAPTPTVHLRNMIQVPPNCPPGWKLGADGVCREVID